MSAASRLRRLIDGDRIVFGPGIFDCLSARIAAQAGFAMLFTSGYGMAASRLGAPDIGLLSGAEVLDQVGRICDSVDLPVVADLDTGYGNALNVVQSVKGAIKAGAAGVILEDQQWPKKCGHMAGKAVIPAEEHAAKLRAAVDARGGHDLVIVARTDARAIHGLDDALARGRLYHAAGADVVFVEAPQSAEELTAVAEGLPGIPLFANMVEGGRTPILSRDALERLGFRLGVFPLAGLFAATRAMQDCFAHLQHHGTTEGLDTGLAFGDFEQVVDTPGWRAAEARYRAGDT